VLVKCFRICHIKSLVSLGLRRDSILNVEIVSAGG
jgi:hypothetical protein